MSQSEMTSMISMPAERTRARPKNPGDNETAPWSFHAQVGPVITTAVHAGHHIRREMKPWLEIGELDRLREEDPLTDYFLGVGDSMVRANRSRFEVDLNRPREKAISTEPEDQWGLKVWSRDLPDEQIEKSRRLHDEFYAMIQDHCEAMIERFDRILVLDVHSYNHRRDGAGTEAAPPEKNPDIDVGATTMDHDIYGELLTRFVDELRSVPVMGHQPLVGVNVRWKDGGNFPEWLHDIYGAKACVMTLEYKKSFMDEWTGDASILALQHLREGLARAVAIARVCLRKTSERMS
jgi:N-formylglutamate amidohydrolase